MGEHKYIEDHRQSMEKISTKKVMINYQHKAEVLELFLCYGLLWDSGETYGKLRRKIYLNTEIKYIDLGPISMY